MSGNKQALIFGATGNIGGAVTRELLRRGGRVRGVTRNPQSEKAIAVASLASALLSPRCYSDANSANLSPLYCRSFCLFTP